MHVEETVTFRPATRADAPAVAANTAAGIESYREWAPAAWSPPAPVPRLTEHLRSRLGDEDVWCLVALHGDELIGHVSLSSVTGENPEPAPPGMANLWQMFVRHAWQGRGIAPRLMREAVAEAGRRGFTALRLWTPEGAARARRFYEREGWAHTGAVRRDSPFGLPLVEYRREVGGRSG